MHWRDAADVLHSGGSGLINYRMKLDLFLFRMRSQLTCVKACTTIAHYRAIQALCGFLVDYVKNCYTRVAVPCVIDTCMEALLEIAKNLFDPEIDFSTINAEKLRAIIHLLDVFDSLGFRSTMGSTTELLVNLFVDSEVFWLFVRRFMGEFFLNNSVYTSLKDEKRSGVGRELIKQVRLRLVSHFRACVALVKRHYETTKRGFAQSMGVDNSLLIRLLLTKFEFLVIPGSGAIPRFFDTHRSPYDQYHIKIEMLRLLIDLFGFPESPLVTRSLKYVDFYISDSYLSFIKLFNSNDFDDATLQMCRLYMEVLIQFSKIKQQSVRMKISQLRIMDFLANQIDLEYQMTLLTDESASQAPEKYSSLSAVTEDIAMRRSPRPQVRRVMCFFSSSDFLFSFSAIPPRLLRPMCRRQKCQAPTSSQFPLERTAKCRPEDRLTRRSRQKGKRRLTLSTRRKKRILVRARRALTAAAAAIAATNRAARAREAMMAKARPPRRQWE